jgi:hypothetical protein
MEFSNSPDRVTKFIFLALVVIFGLSDCMVLPPVFLSGYHASVTDPVIIDCGFWIAECNNSSSAKSNRPLNRRPLQTGGRSSLTTGENLPVYVQMCWTAKKPVSLIRKSEDTKL